MPVIPATLEAEIRRMEVESQHRQKVIEAPSQSISWAWWHASAIWAMGGHM
jgi:hypothetical protein